MQNDVGHMTTSAALVSLCKNSVREIRYDYLTARRISSFKSRIFRGLLTYTNELRVPQGKNHKELSHMTLVVIDDHHYAR